MGEILRFVPNDGIIVGAVSTFDGEIIQTPNESHQPQIHLYTDSFGGITLLPTLEVIRSELSDLLSPTQVSRVNQGILPDRIQTYLSKEGGFFDQLQAEELKSEKSRNRRTSPPSTIQALAADN